MNGTTPKTDIHDSVDRLLWKDKTRPACTYLILSWKALLSLLSLFMTLCSMTHAQHSSTALAMSWLAVLLLENQSRHLEVLTCKQAQSAGAVYCS